MKPVFTEKSGKLTALLATAPDGTQYLVRVDEENPSRLKLKCTVDGRLYALETTATQVGWAGRETCRPLGVPQSATHPLNSLYECSQATKVHAALSKNFRQLTRLSLLSACLQLDLRDRAAMEKVFRTQGWEQRLKPLP